MAKVLSRHVPSWNQRAFVKAASGNLDSLELKERSEQIYNALCEYLPADFPTAAECIRHSLHPAVDGNARSEGTTEQGIQGWLILPLTEYVGRHGDKSLSLALELLKELTMRFTSEFGIRHLWLSRPEEVMPIVSQWVHHESEHVRRLVSEGSRPRLPWGLQLRGFIEQPKRTWHLLEALRDDSSPYVRKSVANHLNDNARDHPECVVELARDWQRGASQDRQRLIRHALRNLLKKGHPQALSLYQLDQPLLQEAELHLNRKHIAMGQELEFSLDLISAGSSSQTIRLDYVIHHRKANGRTSPKVFRWKDIALVPNLLQRCIRRHSFRPVSTRVYYPGLHLIEIKANGIVIAESEFQLSQ
jgi:3-methyladenine DNA glycosylase AlkC